MTATASMFRSAASARGSPPVLRAAVWSLHVVVVTLAVLSAVFGRFDFWLDLRMLGWFRWVVQYAWVIATLLVPLCAGPRMEGFSRPRWAQTGFSARQALQFLWPTYLILACLGLNTIYYVVLLHNGRVDSAAPAPAIAGFVLLLWVGATRAWIFRQRSRRGGGGMMPATARTSRASRLLAWLFMLPIVATMVGAFYINAYARPPEHWADVAVVLGCMVNPDGTASWELGDRVRAAALLYRQGKVGRILLSGAVYPNTHRRRDSDPAEINEVTAMKKVCIDSGVPEDAISEDPVGINTRATAFNTKTFMLENKLDTAVVCTSSHHLYRSTWSMREQGINAWAVPSAVSDWECASVMGTLRELCANIVYETNPHYREAKGLLMHVTNPRLVVKKSANVVELYDGANLVKTYTCITGGNPGDKEIEGDRKTPLGTFHIVYKNPESKFHLSLGIDYPNKEDADRGLAAGLITKEQYDGILAALHSDLSKDDNQKKLWKTPLGGEIFLHGYGEGRTGTAGCVALSNSDIEELYAILPIGTPVEISP